MDNRLKIIQYIDAIEKKIETYGCFFFKEEMPADKKDRHLFVKIAEHYGFKSRVEWRNNRSERVLFRSLSAIK